jgi:hypothetical protein
MVSKIPAPATYSSLSIEERKAWAHPSFGDSFSSPFGLDQGPVTHKPYSARRLATNRYALIEGKLASPKSCVDHSS